MPLYEYECAACGHRFEAIQKFSNRPLRACPRCKGSVKRLISTAAIQFKGTGWYVTDYARKPAASETGSDGTGAKETAKEAASAPAEKSGNAGKAGSSADSGKAGSSEESSNTSASKSSDK